MNIEDLSSRLDKAISAYEYEAGIACNYCDNEANISALGESHKATAKALSSFKAEILTYLSQM